MLPDEAIRMWAIEQAGKILVEVTTVQDVRKFVLETATNLEEFVVEGPNNEKLTYDEGTMNKVYDALRENGFLKGDIENVISSFQNRGILFRERAEDA